MNKKEIFWNPKEDEAIEGVVVAKLEDIGKYSSNLYKIETSDEIYIIWGSYQMDSLFELVSCGDLVSLRYVGIQKTKNHQMKKYELEIL